MYPFPLKNLTQSLKYLLSLLQQEHGLYPTELINQAIKDATKQRREGLVLTCKDKLIPYYSKFGFVNEDISESVHGNVTWYLMTSLPSMPASGILKWFLMEFISLLRDIEDLLNAL